MDIMPGDIFSLKRHPVEGRRMSYSGTYKMRTIEKRDDGYRVTATPYGSLYEYLERGQAEVLFSTVTPTLYGTFYERAYSVHVDPRDGAWADEVFTMVTGEDGVISVQGYENVDVVQGVGFYAIWKPSLERWKTNDTVNEVAVREELWFHATLDENWDSSALTALDERGNSLLIHAGSKSAAIERMRSIMKIRPNPSPFKLFALRLNNDSKIYSNVVADQSMDWHRYHDEAMLDADVFTYENEHEDVSSISLCGRLSAFKIVGVETLESDDYEDDDDSDWYSSGPIQAKNRSRMVVA